MQTIGIKDSWRNGRAVTEGIQNLGFFDVRENVFDDPK